MRTRRRPPRSLTERLLGAAMRCDATRRSTLRSPSRSCTATASLHDALHVSVRISSLRIRSTPHSLNHGTNSRHNHALSTLQAVHSAPARHQRRQRHTALARRASLSPVTRRQIRQSAYLVVSYQAARCVCLYARASAWPPNTVRSVCCVGCAFCSLSRAPHSSVSNLITIKTSALPEHSTEL